MEIRLATLNDIGQLCHLFTEFFAYNAALQPEFFDFMINAPSDVYANWLPEEHYEFHKYIS